MTEQFVKLKKLLLAPKKKTPIQKRVLKAIAKKRLFSDEILEDSSAEAPSTSSTPGNRTPLSYKPLIDSLKSIFFIGYKKFDDKYFYCVDCFEDKHQIDTTDHPEYISTGERPFYDSNTLKPYQPTLTDYCIRCHKQLYIITTKDSTHLSFH
jgi:hypothetical protein